MTKKEIALLTLMAKILMESQDGIPLFRWYDEKDLRRFGKKIQTIIKKYSLKNTNKTLQL